MSERDMNQLNDRSTNDLSNGSISDASNDSISKLAIFIEQMEAYIDAGLFSYLDLYSAKMIASDQIRQAMVGKEVVENGTIGGGATGDEVIENMTTGNMAIGNGAIGKEFIGIALLTLLVSRAYRYGHIVLPIDYLLDSSRWFHEENIDDRDWVIQSLLTYAEIESADDWRVVLEKIEPPLIKSKHGIYLEKQYQLESRLVQFMSQSRKPYALNENEITFVQKTLKRYFRSDEMIDWQSVAAINTLLQPISIISGGPGTGKTTTIFNILLILLELAELRSELSPHTVLAAPTGKAAARLTESINGQKQTFQARYPESIMHLQIPSDSFTLHRLLGIDPITQVPRYNHDNPLTVDLLVIDEASMIDLSMFVKVIDALPPHARLVLLGDRDQLASVEAGSVMYELCQEEGYSEDHRLLIERLLGVKLPKNEQSHSFDYLSVLKKSYRFNDQSQLGELAQCINGDEHPQKKAELMEILERETTDQQVEWHSLPIEESDLEQIILQSFATYIEKIRDPNVTIEAIFESFNRVRYLAIQRQGNYGINRLNEQIAKILFPQDHALHFYHGLAIMIEENDYNYGLFNGDIGLIIERENGLRAYFELEEGIKDFSIHVLPQHDRAFAMTVHKSQGSEFDHVYLFLADYPSAFLTKELLYTGVTRAKEAVTLFSATSALIASLHQRTNRFSFIHQRLLDLKSGGVIGFNLKAHYTQAD